MQLPLEYMLKMSVCLAVSYAFYYFLLRHITHYTWNRWYLLGCTLLSFIAPAININLFVEPAQLSHIYFINKLPAIYNGSPATNASATSPLWDVQNVAAIVFIAGILLLAVRLCIQFLSLVKLQGKAKLVSNGEIRLYHLEAGIAPFSFNNSIYCNNTLYSGRELEEVIRHEMVHVQQKHTVDVLLAELLCIVSWYNPLAWMMRRAIKENLEFIADDTVLQNGINRQGYQYLILKVTGNMPQGIANSLNFSSLKKRMAMMNKSKTSKAHLLKFLFVLPVVCCMLVAFRHGDAGYSSPTKQITADDAFTVGSLTYYINDTKAEAIVKSDAGNSLLKPGGLLSLSLMRDEKNRLAGVLQKNGFANINEHAITFLMDTSSASKSFNVQVTINIPNGQVKAGNGSQKQPVTALDAHDRLNTPSSAVALKTQKPLRDNTAAQGALQVKTGNAQL